MVGLSTLPPEILAHILTGNDSNLYLKLWKCGDRILNGRLCQGGCPRVTLNDYNMTSASRFPTSLLSLPCLQELVIRRNGVLAPSLKMAQWLQQLPSTLQKLDIECQKSLTFLLRSAPNTRVIQSPNSKKDNTSLLWDVKKFFPTLRWLGIQTPKGDNNDALPFVLKDVTGILPDTLTYLALSVIHSEGDLLTILPPNLETINLKYYPLAAFTWPASLTHIEGCNVFPQIADSVPHLPRGLRQLSCKQFSVPMAQGLPPALTSLEVTSVAGDVKDWASQGNFATWTASLPHQLTRLKCETLEALNYDHIRYLPRSLESLEAPIHFASLDKVYTENGGDSHGLQQTVSCWPPHLRALTNTVQSALTSNEFLKFLPNTLIRLFGIFVAPPDDNDPLSAFQWTSFPDSLKELSISGTRVAFLAPLPDLIALGSTGVIDLCDNKTLPSTLTSLSIGSLAPSNDENLKWAQRPIHVSMLPPSLKTLEITYATSQMSPSIVAQLPSSLTELSQIRTPFEPAILEVLPFGLKRLGLSCQPLSYPPHFGTLKLTSLILGNNREKPFERNLSVSLDNWPESAFSTHQNYFTYSPWKSRYEAIRLRSMAFPDPRTLYTD